MAAGMRPSTFRLSDYFTPATIILALRSRSKPDVIRELLGTLELPAREESVILRTILRREEMGSTGIGRGIAVPHGRTPLVSKLRLPLRPRMSICLSLAGLPSWPRTPRYLRA
jgi:hypothetical protein